MPPPTKSPFDPKEYRVIRLDNGLVALLISAECTVARRIDSDKDIGLKGSSKCESCSEGESGEEEEEKMIVGGTSDDGENEDHVTCLGEADLPNDLAGTGGHVNGIRRRQDQSYLQRDQAACAVCIGVGSFSDPNEVPGVAHLLEHMVFLGSEKYPGESSFGTFITRHGGYCDACTGCEKTVFEFCIQQSYLREALDRLAQFFVSPQLLEEYLDREIEAVDNEFQDASQIDENRIEQLFSSCVANPKHPASMFIWGNRESLKITPKKKGINVAKVLRDFHLQFYSSHLMTVAVMSRDPLDTLEVWTREVFSSVPCRQTSPASSPSVLCSAFDDSLFCRLYKVVPVEDIQEVHITWVLPSQSYRIKPMYYLGWLLDSEGDGSVLSLLKMRQLATHLETGNRGGSYDDNSCYSFFTCIATLTNNGLENVLECITLIFQYFKMLRELGPQEWIYQEIQAVEEKRFNSIDEKTIDNPVYCVSMLSESMQYFPEEDFLTGYDLMFQYDHQSIAAFQDMLTPEKANILLVSKKFAPQCAGREKWFGTQFSSEELPSDWMAGWQNLPLNPHLHLPAPTMFTSSTKLSLKTCISPQQKYPVMIDECDHYKLWFRRDSVYLAQRGYVCVLFRTAVHLESARNSFMMSLFLHLLNEKAAVSQLGYCFGADVQGMTLCVHGSNYKLRHLMETLITIVAHFSVSEEHFQTFKDDVTRYLQNYLLKPKKYAKVLMQKILQCHRGWSATNALSLSTIDSVTLKELTEFVNNFKRQMFVELLVQANIAPEEAKQMVKYICNHLEFSPLLMSSYDAQQPKAVQLPENTHIIVEAVHKNKQSPSTVIVDYFQCAATTKSVTESVMLQLLIYCINEPCFNMLRTKQLGYSVLWKGHNTFGIGGVSLTLSTHESKCSTKYACGCINRFLEDFLNSLSSWTESYFHSHVDSLFQSKLEPDISLQNEVGRNWKEVVTQSYQFDRLEKEVEVLRSVTRKGMLEWYQRYIIPNPECRRLSIKVVSHHTTSVDFDAEDKEMECSVDSPIMKTIVLKEEEVEAFKKKCPLYPMGENEAD